MLFKMPDPEVLQYIPFCTDIYLGNDWKILLKDFSSILFDDHTNVVHAPSYLLPIFFNLRLNPRNEGKIPYQVHRVLGKGSCDHTQSPELLVLSWSCGTLFILHWETFNCGFV